MRAMLRRWWMLAALWALASCRAPAPAPPTDGWTPMFDGVEFRAWVRSEPRLMRLYAARIDLHADGVDVLVTPGNGPRRKDHDAQTTSMFARRHDCQLAINASPFSPVFQNHGGPKDVRGVSMSRGRLDSPPNGKYGAIAFGRERPATIFDGSVRIEDLHGFDHVVGGFEVVLRDGVDVSARATEVRGVHPRVAVGLSRDAQFLYILVVDGRQRGFSQGASLADLAAVLAELGADDGLNFDGGGSSAFVAQRGDTWAQLNVPNHMLRRGVERVVPNHLCVYARALGEAPASPQR